LSYSVVTIFIIVCGGAEAQEYLIVRLSLFLKMSQEGARSPSLEKHNHARTHHAVAS